MSRILGITQMRMHFLRCRTALTKAKLLFRGSSKAGVKKHHNVAYIPFDIGQLAKALFITPTTPTLQSPYLILSER
jgi:hypothetical protein